MSTTATSWVLAVTRALSEKAIHTRAVRFSGDPAGVADYRPPPTSYAYGTDVHTLAKIVIPSSHVLLLHQASFWGRREGYRRAMLPPSEMPVEFLWRMENGIETRLPVVVSGEANPHLIPKINPVAMEGPNALVADFRLLTKEHGMDEIGVYLAGSVSCPSGAARGHECVRHVW